MQHKRMEYVSLSCNSSTIYCTSCQHYYCLVCKTHLWYVSSTVPGGTLVQVALTECIHLHGTVTSATHTISYVNLSLY